MILARTIEETENYLSTIRREGKCIGLVPTMGSLHAGHLSLVNCCRAENDVTVVTIFVNPAQFNDPEDFERYPRNPDQDLHKLERTGCEMVFIPDVETIYPEPDRRTFDFGKLGKIMEGRSRPGHFNGVARVVSRLFDIIKPDRAYFGEKDIQQLAIIRKMAAVIKSPVEIRACATLRESDGLAMSSRNMLLNERERKNAALIIQTLRKALQKQDLQVNELKQWVAGVINQNPFLELDYFEIVNSSDLKPVIDWSDGEGKLIGCIAVFVGKVRLIDNIFFSNFATL